MRDAYKLCTGMVPNLTLLGDADDGLLRQEAARSGDTFQYLSELARELSEIAELNGNTVLAQLFGSAAREASSSVRRVN